MDWQLSQLPFVCAPTPPLVFRKRFVAWEELVPPARDAELPSKLTGSPRSFPSAGAIAEPPQHAVLDPHGISFAREGAFNLITPCGAFKILILPEEDDGDDVLRICCFFSANVVHSGIDMLTLCPGSSSGELYLPNLLYKLFRTDQPLQLKCGPASLGLVTLVNVLGYSARQVVLDGHVTAEVLHRDQWILVDPDFDAVAAAPKARRYASVSELISGDIKTEIRSLSKKRWIKWVTGWEFHGQTSWTPILNQKYLCSEVFSARIREMQIVRYRQVHAFPTAGVYGALNA